MPREDIIGGLKNALARGQPLQSAIQSFLNAGYAKEDVEEAARSLSSSNAGLNKLTPAIQAKPIPIIKQISSSTTVVQQDSKTERVSADIIILLLILIAIFGLSLVLFFIFGGDIASFFGS